MTRAVLSYLLVLLLTFTGQQVAYARGQIDTSGTAILCLGGGLVAVPLGPDGTPSGPGHVCPHATLGVPVDIVTPAPAPRTLVLLPAAAAQAPVAPTVQTLRLLPPSRAPPLTV